MVFLCDLKNNFNSLLMTQVNGKNILFFHFNILTHQYVIFI